jgi:hypothetical protein
MPNSSKAWHMLAISIPTLNVVIFWYPFLRINARSMGEGRWLVNEAVELAVESLY